MNIFLKSLSKIYKAVTLTHKKLYQLGLLRAIRLEKPVISIGNLTSGGTGKTPFAEAIVNNMKSKRVAILSRGYGRQSRETFLVDSHHSPEQVGDEPYWLFKKQPSAKIIVSPNRAKVAVDFSPLVDVFVLDDGLQHYRLKRDLEITLIDALAPLNSYELLPLGRAREDWSALNRSHLAVITRANQVPPSHLKVLREIINQNMPIPQIIEAAIELDKVTELLSHSTVELSAQRVLLASGIGNSFSFEKLVSDLGVFDIAGHIREKDHQNYSLNDIVMILTGAREKKATRVLITEKDAVKWREKLITNPNNVIVDIGVVQTKLVFSPQLPDMYDLACHYFH